MSTSHGWTVVQHSGYGYSGKPGFEHAVESRVIESARERRTIESEGGLVFAKYNEAEDFAEAANFPEGASGIYPEAKGTFSEKMIDGLRIYIPVREVKG